MVFPQNIAYVEITFPNFFCLFIALIQDYLPARITLAFPLLSPSAISPKFEKGLFYNTSNKYSLLCFVKVYLMCEGHKFSGKTPNRSKRSHEAIQCLRKNNHIPHHITV